MTSKKEQTLGGRLRAARLDANLSQTQLSEHCGIPKPTLSRYENDHVLPSLPTVVRLAKGLDVPVIDLVNNTERGEQLLIDALRRRGIKIHSIAEAEHFVDLIEDSADERRSRRGHRA